MSGAASQYCQCRMSGLAAIIAFAAWVFMAYPAAVAGAETWGDLQEHGHKARRAGDLAEAARQFEAARRWAENAADQGKEAASLHSLASLYEFEHRYKEAADLYKRSLSLRRGLLETTYEEAIDSLRGYEQVLRKLKEDREVPKIKAELDFLQKKQSIGSASMKEDGTLVLHLRAEGPGIVGDSLEEFKKDHPAYQRLLRHLGGLQPSESKRVPPWLDQE